MSIPGTVPVTGPVAPTSTLDTYASHLAEYGKGGYRTVANTTARDAITTLRREAGMEVFVLSDSHKYRLEADLITWTDLGAALDPDDVMLKTVYDPNDNGLVTDSEQLDGQAPAYYLDRTNHTGTQAQSTITDLVADLAAKEETANKGQANGYVPLDGSTKIDNSYLNFTLPLDPVIAWDVVTNTPTISDAGGSAGEIYIVYNSANPTVRDLGSGNESWNDGDAAIYDSGTSTFKKIGAYSVGVTAWNTLTGAINATTGDLPPSTDRNYITDDENDALAASNSPSATNPIATMNDLLGVVVVGNTLFTPELFANGETLGDGTLRTLTSLGYTNGTAATAWPRVDAAYTIDVNTMSIDWICWQEACLAMAQDGYSSLMSIGGRGYCFDRTVDLPKNQTSYSYYRRNYRFIFNFNGSGFYNRTGNDFIYFDKYPVDQAEANGNNLDYGFTFLDGHYEGNDSANSADCFIRIGGTTFSTFERIRCDNVGIGVNLEFCMFASLRDCRFNAYGLYGVNVGDGQWSGSAVNIAQSNNVVMEQLRFYGGSGKTPTAGIYSSGNRNIYGKMLTFEGYGGGEHHFLYDNLTASTVKNLVSLEGVDFETAGVTRAGIRIRATAGQAMLKGFNNQVPIGDMAVLLEAESVTTMSTNPLNMFVDRATYDFHTGWKFRHMGAAGYVKWYVENVALNNTVFTNASNWDTSLGGSTIPTTYRYTAPL